MTRHLHEPANALLYKALDLPPQDRQRFVDDACVGQPDLRELVNTLLARISQLDEFLDTPADLPPAQRLAPIVVPAPVDELAGESIPGAGVPPAEHPTAPVQVRKGRPLAAAAAGMVLGVLLGGAGFALWQMRGADRPRVFADQRLDQSAKLRNGMQGEIDDAYGKAPSAAREKLVAAAQEYQVQLATVRRGAGQLEAARQAAALSIDFAEKLLQARPDDARARSQSSAAHMLLGRVLVEQGHAADGLVEMRKALALRESIAAGAAGGGQVERDVADAHATIGQAMAATGDYAAAEQELRLARDSYAAQQRANPADAALQAALIETEISRADVQNLQHHGRDAVQSLAALHALSAGAADPYLAARIALLDAYIQPRGTAAMAYASAGQALAELLKHSENDPLDADQQRASAMAWERTGEIGLRAGQTQSACSYLDLAAKRYADLEASKRLNAIDLLRQDQLQQQRKACR